MRYSAEILFHNRIVDWAIEIYPTVRGCSVQITITPLDHATIGVVTIRPIKRHECGHNTGWCYLKYSPIEIYPTVRGCSVQITITPLDHATIGVVTIRPIKRHEC